MLSVVFLTLLRGEIRFERFFAILCEPSTRLWHQSVSPQSVNPMQGMVPIVKRTATIDGKSGIPVYQPTAGSTSAYQQALAAMQLQPQQYVPAVTSESFPPIIIKDESLHL
ncbi:hypothetical protein LSH36_381g02002 [Paralvinella palmiformis]|uniref:Uncharacterized protein n=1 Tax=Paralvinella palmiformis TaxID=53620 RepID=A0AAD9JD81_9ANNE|nr:hypothetical protein LSH36_381g02002 [Paralvinella palmiformis]